MALSITQMQTVSYPAVLNEKRKPTNQWAENAAMRELEKRGALKRKSFGTTLQRLLDYRRNPGAEFLSSDLAPVSMVKTEVLTAADYAKASLSVPLVWSKEDEASNDTEVQKVALVKSLLTNAIDSHDDLIEQAIFSTSTNGFLGFQNLVFDDGAGTWGGIDGDAEAWARNYSADYAANGSDIDAELTAAWNDTAKGSGSSGAVNLILSGAEAQAIYEASQQTLKRFIDTDEADSGFKVLAFKTARWIFSQYGGTRIYGLNTQNYNIDVARSAFRDLGDKYEIPDANGFGRKIYTLLQATIDNPSRLFVITQA